MAFGSQEVLQGSRDTKAFEKLEKQMSIWDMSRKRRKATLTGYKPENIVRPINEAAFAYRERRIEVKIRLAAFALPDFAA